MSDKNSQDIQNQSNIFSKLEFAVQISCDGCSKAIRKQLDGVQGIDSVIIDPIKGSVIVETSLPSTDIQKRIEAAGKSTILRGVGGKDTNLGAAVAILGGESGFSFSGVKGVVRFIQADKDNCVIDGTIDGLTPGKHGLHVHEFGDISKGGESVGGHYNPYKATHGNRVIEEGEIWGRRHAGDLGNVTADEKGRASFRFTDNFINVSDVIGRSICVTEKEDDLGLSIGGTSKIDGNSGQRLACGIIARSAGLFENTKKICACDGLTLWDEINKPAAGKERQSKPQE